ncbi:MAG: poly-gamma-glutamate biosynthesis protein PgsC/CapC, partial [Actinomycetota bacterium]
APQVLLPLFGLYLVVGLWIYERFGSRLGGVLVLPFVVVYALIDLLTLVVFAVGAVASFAGGEALYRTTLLYGRRLLVAFLLISLASSLVVSTFLETSIGGIFLPIVPGLFAYNIHREGRPVWGAAMFLAVLVAVLGGTILVGGVLREFA